ALAGGRLVDRGMLPSRVRRLLRASAAIFAVSMGFAALARPQVGTRWETLERRGTDLLLVMDASRSMDADDVKPTRLGRAKIAVRDLVARIPGDRIGLVAFAGDAFVESPMTLDHDALLETLDAVDTSTVALGGTDIGRAIDVASAVLTSEPDHQKEMVLITDGEDLESKGEDAAKRAGAAGIVIHTLGVGTANGELVPARNDQGATVGVVRTDSGEPVRSRLDESGLRRIAQAAHGTYRPLGADGRGLQRLYDEALAPLSHLESAARVRRVYAERFEIPLALSLAGVLLEAFLATRGRSRKNRRGSLDARPAVAAVAAAVSVAFLSGPARASVRSAEKAYAAGRYADAVHEYSAEQQSHPKDARLAYNAGAAAYRAGQYEEAVGAFGQAIALSDPELQQHALYDQGDARYRAGEAQRAAAPDKTIEDWKAAIAAYDGAIALNGRDADAIYNRDLVRRKLGELEKKQDEKKQENKKQDGKTKPNEGGEKREGNQQSQDKKQSQDDKRAKGDPSGSPSNPGEQGKAEPPRNDGQPNAKSSPGQGQRPNTVPAEKGADAQDGEGKGAEPGRLSAREARALLGSLRGEERRGVSRSSNNPTSDVDVPRKDW
ncbi:MAG TPA: VWA domain-containing protein, partial [Polyangiaceae bacterium]